MLLPIAREGAPFLSAAGVVGVAPDLGLTLGFVCSADDRRRVRRLRTSPSRTEMTQEPRRRAVGPQTRRCLLPDAADRHRREAEGR